MTKPWVLSYPLSAQQRLWSDWSYSQADLSLLWAHSHFAGFDMSRLIQLLASWSELFIFLKKYKNTLKSADLLKSLTPRVSNGPYTAFKTIQASCEPHKGSVGGLKISANPVWVVMTGYSRFAYKCSQAGTPSWDNIRRGWIVATSALYRTGTVHKQIFFIPWPFKIILKELVSFNLNSPFKVFPPEINTIKFDLWSMTRQRRFCIKIKKVLYFELLKWFPFKLSTVFKV